MSAWWILGEAVNYLHCFGGAFLLLGGVFWCRPIWPWTVFVCSTVVTDLTLGACPVTLLANWLQSRSSPSVTASLLSTYGPYGPMLAIGLVAAGLYTAFLFRKPLPRKIIARPIDLAPARLFASNANRIRLFRK